MVTILRGGNSLSPESVEPGAPGAPLVGAMGWEPGAPGAPSVGAMGWEPALRTLLSHLISRDWVLVDEIAQFLRQHLSVARNTILRQLEAAPASSAADDASRSRLLRWILKGAEIKSGENQVA
ncbi:MAG: hypothetical protein WCC87_25265 [Candidatus Korobacteraceae bacterium]